MLLSPSFFFFYQEIEPDITDGVGAERGHIIATVVGGRNGQPKQVARKFSMFMFIIVLWFAPMTVTKFVITKQAVTYIAEHVVGTGSFGVVFQVLNFVLFSFFSNYYIYLLLN